MPILGAAGGLQSKGWANPKAHGSPIGMTAPQAYSNLANLNMTEGIITAAPFFLDGTATLTKMFFRTQTPASTGALARLGVYANLPGDLSPGALLLDTGTVNATAAFSVVAITLATPFPMTPGIYWIVGKGEGAPTTPVAISAVLGTYMILPYAGLSGNATVMNQLVSRTSTVGYRSAVQAAGPFPSIFPHTGETKVEANHSGNSVYLIGLEFTS